MKPVRSALALAAAILPLFMVSAGVWCATSGQPWILTGLIFSLGVLYLIAPPSSVVPKAYLILFGLLFLLVAVAFLPASWFGASFRQPFLDHGFILPWTMSPQPWLTLEDLTLLFATVLWGWSCLEAKLSVEQRQFLVTIYLVVLGLIATNTILHKTTIGQEMPSFFQMAGQFDNRNHTGDVLLLGGIFSFAQGFFYLSKKKLIGLFWLILTLVFIVAIVRNGSRAATGLFGIGLIIFLCLTPRRKRHSQAALAALVGVGILAVLIFAFEGAEMQARFVNLMLGHEGRFPIWQDCAGMIMHNPWSGVGLGNFEGVFNTLRNHSAPIEVRAFHPDSDLCLLAAELGLGGVIIIALIVATTFRSYLSKTPFPSLTQASTTVAILFLIHALCDVSGHRIGTVWSCLYLVGMGAYRTDTTSDIRLPQILLRMAGLLLIALAGLRAQSMSFHPWMPTRGTVMTIESSLPAHPFQEQKELLNQCIEWEPLYWKLYNYRGFISLHTGDLAESEADFNRVLFLDQNDVDVPIYIGAACRLPDLPEAMVAWKALLERKSGRSEEFYQNLWYEMPDEPTRTALATLAGDDPNLQMIVVINQDLSKFEGLRQNFLAAHPSLEGISPDLTKRFFDRWEEVGDSNELITEWPLHPEWKNSGWKAYVRTLAKVGRYQDAVPAALQLMPPPPMPDFPANQDVDAATRQFEARPTDAYEGVLLYFAQKSAGMNDQALATLKTVAKLPNVPSYIQYLLVKDLAATDQGETTWELLSPLLDQSNLPAKSIP